MLRSSVTEGADLVSAAQCVAAAELDHLLGKPTIEQQVGSPISVTFLRRRAQQPAREQPDVEALYVVLQVGRGQARDVPGGDEHERLDVPIMLPPYLDLVDMTDRRILIADDVADTGKTIELVRNFCNGKVAETRCAVLYQKPTSLVNCDYVWKHTDRWINFPWSDQPPIVQHGDRLVLDA